MNWTEFFDAAGGFVNATLPTLSLLLATFIGAAATAFIRIQNGKLSSIQSEANEAKEHAASAANEVKESRKEHSDQIQELRTDAKSAYDHSNNTNDKMALQNQELLRLRRELSDLKKTVNPDEVAIKPSPLS